MDELELKLIDALTEAKVAREQSTEAIRLANECMIEIKAMQMSTHKTVFVSGDDVATAAKDLKPGESKEFAPFKQSEAEMAAKMELQDWNSIEFEADPMGQV